VTWLNTCTMLIVLGIISWIFLAISESGRRDYSQSLLNRISGGLDFAWFSCPPRGRSGGILLEVKSESVEVLADSYGEFHIKLHI
jgi:hypothetical protein